MNIFRSLARGILNGLRGGRPVEGEARDVAPVVVDGFDPAPVSAVPKVVRADRYESSFTPASSQGDSFERAERSAPVDLSGGVKVHYTLVDESAAATAPPQEFFAASLDDLDLSMLPELPLGEGRGEGAVAPPEAEVAAAEGVEAPVAPATEVEAPPEAAAVALTAPVALPAAEVEAAVALPLAEAEAFAAPAAFALPAFAWPVVEAEAAPRSAPFADSGFVASFDDLPLLPSEPEAPAAASGFLASLEDLGLLDPHPLPEGPEGEGTPPKTSAHDVELEALLLLPKPD
ncbi:MAG: hypothetical protein Q8N23_31885 [Archangium sp.]|nr:hypothetical protein [Archangium sp.]MDP3571155.1 hypothetical protein [Archangium sp.]